MLCEVLGKTLPLEACPGDAGDVHGGHLGRERLDPISDDRCGPVELGVRPASHTRATAELRWLGVAGGTVGERCHFTSRARGGRSELDLVAAARVPLVASFRT